MRRLIALAAIALVAPALALTASTTAQAAPNTAKAAPATPADALRQQFAKKGGVHLDEDTRMLLDGDDLFRYRQVGSLRFAKSGVDAFDLKIISRIGTSAKDGESTLRAVQVGKKLYLKSPLYDDILPAGKTWVRTAVTGSSTSTGSMIDILQPKVLKAVLATTKVNKPAGKVGGAKTTLYQGAIPLKTLAKVSPQVASLAKSLKTKKTVTLPWKLWLGTDQLPRRFTSTFPMSTSPKAGELTILTDSRYTAWDAKVVITVPPADQVIDEKDLDSDLPETTPDFTTTVTGLASRER